MKGIKIGPSCHCFNVSDLRTLKFAVYVQMGTPDTKGGSFIMAEDLPKCPKCGEEYFVMGMNYLPKDALRSGPEKYRLAEAGNVKRAKEKSDEEVAGD